MANRLNFHTPHNRETLVTHAITQAMKDLSPNQRREKLDKMLSSPFVFFRGTSHLFWQDVYHDWRIALFGGRQETQTWLQGDAHVYNFGAFFDHSDRVIYGLDDFDDSIVGDYQYDLWRLAASVVLDVWEKGHIPNKGLDQALEELANSYLDGVAHYTDDYHRDGHSVERATNSQLRKFLEKTKLKKTRQKMLGKWTVASQGNVREFSSHSDKLATLSLEERQQLEGGVDRYLATLVGPMAGKTRDHFHIKDMARRLKAGTGSLGCSRYYLLIEGDDDNHHDDVILDIKQQSSPPAIQHFNDSEAQLYRQQFENEAHRHQEAFRDLSSHPDRYLGYFSMNGKFFSVRERSPAKADFPTEKLKNPEKLVSMCRSWGVILSRHHSRASYHLHDSCSTQDQFKRTLLSLTNGKRGDFVTLLRSIAIDYAHCVLTDYATVKNWNQRKH